MAVILRRTTNSKFKRAHSRRLQLTRTPAEFRGKRGKCRSIYRAIEDEKLLRFVRTKGETFCLCDFWPTETRLSEHLCCSAGISYVRVVQLCKIATKPSQRDHFTLNLVEGKHYRRIICVSETSEFWQSRFSRIYLWSLFCCASPFVYYDESLAETYVRSDYVDTKVTRSNDRHDSILSP